ncbi:MAG: hypothetical protein ACUZ77_08950 [Candidatus Brocadiales bacterium]
MGSNDILGKTNGCGNSEAPDKNEWVSGCTLQELIYPCLLDAIAMSDKVVGAFN